MKRITWFLSVGAALMLLASVAMADSNPVDICHVPPGNLDNAHTITVSERAVPAHLAHGDCIGACPCSVVCGVCDQDLCTLCADANCANRCPTPESQCDPNDEVCQSCLAALCLDECLCEQ